MGSMITRPASAVGSTKRLTGRLCEHCVLDGLIEPGDGCDAVALGAGEAGVRETRLSHVAEVDSSRPTPRACTPALAVMRSGAARAGERARRGIPAWSAGLERCEGGG
jgi:hypothetical protein